MNLTRSQLIDLNDRMNLNTCKARAGNWARNMVMNEPAIRAGRGVKDLFGVLNTFLPPLPVILVGAGPSLDKNISVLKQCQKRALIISCDAAHRSLLEASIKPHMVLVLDSKGDINSYLDYKQSEETILILNSLSHPGVHESWKGPIYWFNPMPLDAEPLTHALIEFTGQIGDIFIAGSVITAMFSLAIVLETQILIFTGVDSAYYDAEKHHATNCPAGSFELYKEIETEDIYGKQCFTNAILSSFSTWLGNACCSMGGKMYINSTEGGILSKGCLLMPLEVTLINFLGTKYKKILDNVKNYVSSDSTSENRWKYKNSDVDIKAGETYLPKDFYTAMLKKAKEVNQ